MRGAAFDGPTALMIESLDALGALRRPLIVGEATGRLAAAVRIRGGEPLTWLRQVSLGAPGTAQAWPTSAGCDGAMVRIPKAKDALELALHASASLVPAGAPVAVFGANAEGIRSAGRRLEDVAASTETAGTGHHGRVLLGRRKSRIEGLKSRLEDWRQVREIELGGVRRLWVSYPGTFAKGGLDEGTAFLLRHLPPLPDANFRVLDYAAGTGVIAAALTMRAPMAKIDLLDADALSIAAAQENVPAARAIIGADMAATGDERYDLIVSNPPIHEGVAESRTVLDRLIATAPQHLERGGRLVIVVQRRVPVMPALAAALEDARILADDGRFSVASAVRRSGAGD